MFIPIVIKTAKSLIFRRNSSVQIAIVIPIPPGKDSLNATIIAILNDKKSNWYILNKLSKQKLYVYPTHEQYFQWHHQQWLAKQLIESI